MKIQTQYNYEKTWNETNENDLLKIIEEEVGDADLQGVLSYIKDTIKDGKIVHIGSCKFKIKEGT